MLNTITINNEFNYLNNRVKGRKPAKMSETKVNCFTKNTKELTKPLDTPKVQLQEEKNIVKEELKEEVKIENFPAKEVYQNRLLAKGVTCYNQVLGNIKAKAARKLRVDSKVVDNQKYVTLNVAIAPEEIKKEDIKTFDFSKALNQEPIQEKPKPSIDDFFKKENDEVKTSSDQPLAQIVDIEEIKRKKDLLTEKKDNISKIELSIQEAKISRLKLQEQLASINKDLDNQLETTEDIELEKTMQLNRIQAEIIKMSELLNQKQAVEENTKTM